METGRVINKRYLLQRFIKHGQICAIYQGTDQVLQRAVAIKAVPASDITAYRTAIKLTAHFSHPNIVGIYDLVVEPEMLYIVQEYIEGATFSAMLQRPSSPNEVVDIGMQICQALMYADTTSNVCHGDLTPSAFLRDSHGLIRLNNFALPGDFLYFHNWCKMGGDEIVLSDTELPYGQQSEGRRADDTRAVGLLLYQLLAGRAPGATVVEPPPDGRLRFQRNTPAELCETLARAVVRQHPQRISTPEALYIDLKSLSEGLAQSASLVMPRTEGIYLPSEEPLIIGQTASSAGGKLASALPVRDTDSPSLKLSSYRPEQGMQLPLEEVAPASPTVADVSLKLAAARQAAYPEPVAQQQDRSSLLPILLIGLVVFILLFIIGYFAGHFLFP